MTCRRERASTRGERTTGGARDDRVEEAANGAPPCPEASHGRASGSKPLGVLGRTCRGASRGSEASKHKLDWS